MAMLKTARRLKLGKLSSAPSSEINVRQAPKESVYKYFKYRYYPQPVTQTTRGYGPVILKDGNTVHLNKHIIFSFVVPIAKTSKSAVLRRRLKHRLLQAFRLCLMQEGPDNLPREPMHMLISPSMTVLLAPFRRLMEDAAETYRLANKQARQSSVPAKARKVTAGKELGSETGMRPPRSRRPDLRGDRYDLVAQQQKTISRIPKTRYLAGHGGAKDLLERMMQSSSGSRS